MQCVGPSMLPTLQPRGDVLLHEKASVRRQTIAVGAQCYSTCQQWAKDLPAEALTTKGTALQRRACMFSFSSLYVASLFTWCAPAGPAQATW